MHIYNMLAMYIYTYLILKFVSIFSHGKKRAKKIQAGKLDVNEADLFDTFRGMIIICL